MKKIAVIALMVLFVVMAVVACNNNICPAYSDNNTEQSGENNG